QGARLRADAGQCRGRHREDVVDRYQGQQRQAGLCPDSLSSVTCPLGTAFGRPGWRAELILRPQEGSGVSEGAFNQATLGAEESRSRSVVLKRLRFSDDLFRLATRTAALVVLALLSGVIIALIIGAEPAISTFGISFVFTEVWNPVTEKFGALAPVYGTL